MAKRKSRKLAKAVNVVRPDCEKLVLAAQASPTIPASTTTLVARKSPGAAALASPHPSASNESGASAAERPVRMRPATTRLGFLMSRRPTNQKTPA
ncbi:MAG: hypothetical protein QM765_06600 [Myxococcales bacterium]